MFITAQYTSVAAQPVANLITGEMFEADTDFTASSADEMTFKIGDTLEVLEKSLEGWWYARYVLSFDLFRAFIHVNNNDF